MIKAIYILSILLVAGVLAIVIFQMELKKDCEVHCAQMAAEHKFPFPVVPRMDNWTCQCYGILAPEGRVSLKIAK